MPTLRLLPAFLASLVLAAHLLRQGWWPGALAVLGAPVCLLVGQRWSVRLLQVLYAVAAAEWLRTLGVLLAARRAHGAPFVRLSVILGAVALVSAAAVPALESWWRLRRTQAPVQARA